MDWTHGKRRNVGASASRSVGCLHSRYWALGLLLMGLCLFAGGPLKAQEETTITVRYIDARTGKPIAARWVFISLEDAPGPPKSYPEKARTGPDGLTVFHLKGPLRKYVSVSPQAADADGCALDEYLTEEVLRTGVIGEKGKCDPKGKLDGTFKPKPGEIVVFGYKLRWYERRFTS